MTSHKIKVAMVLGLILSTLPACGQLKIGDNVSATMSGDLGFGYSTDSGTGVGSSHEVGVNGNVNMSGYYYNPRFLNFHAMGSYDRSQANSNSASLTQSSDYSLGVGLFSGSHFPGSVSWGQGFNSSNSYGVTGLSGLTAHGDNRTFGIGWAEVMPGLPPVTVQYSQQHSSSSLLGTTGEDQSNSRNLTIGTFYNWLGWRMTGRFTDNISSVQIPSFLTAGTTNESETNSRTYLFNANHKIPMKGSLSLSISRGSFTGVSEGVNTSGANTEYVATASFTPNPRSTCVVGAEYNTDLSGLVEQQLVNAGSVTPTFHSSLSGNSFSVYTNDSIAIGKRLGIGIGASWTEQQVGGQTVTAAHWGATLNYRYFKPLWGSVFVYAGVEDQANDSVNQGAGFIGGANLTKRVWGFDAAASVGYSQDVVTVLAVVTTSSYNYSASLQRKINRKLRWNGSFNGFHSGFAEVAGQSNHSESYQTALTYHGLHVGANYSHSEGVMLITAGGLVAAPVSLLPVLGNNTLLANGAGYGFNAGMNPVRRLSISAGYSKVNSNSTSATISSLATSSAFTLFSTYQLRKLVMTGGYVRVTQGVSSGGVFSPPSTYTSYSVGIQRWFNFF